ncbi:sensor histidine kinase [Oceanirhabdus sp. W0125-5]|uniref:sensor histidine kinase n=1 Tax=Oceanirhabdus sp. W0125-5 TaxID=2999116 RepID=UPI0022F3313A|nr:sensor histidine kinase [Oceanirhabdus sp. W0125-5]WBW97293.1 sensor histidine kinase [Oceanirhabdus sp. W0125-5]
MDLIDHKRLKKIVYVALILTSIYMIINNDNRVLMTILSLMIAFSIGYYSMIAKTEKGRIIENIVLVLATLIVYLALYIDVTGVAMIYIFIILGVTIISYSTKFGIVFVCGNFILTLSIAYMKTENFELTMILPIIVQFYFVYTFIFLLKNQIEQKSRFEQLSNELKRKSEELKFAYGKMQETMDIREEVVVLKERNRLAGEIHDAVGHTLTTALVQLEVCIRLIEKDKKEAKGRLEIVQNQVRKGLKDIRLSIKDLKSDREDEEFISSIKRLVSETEKSSDVKIDTYVGDIPEINTQIQNALYRAIQEGLTNGIRHGESNNFEITIKNDDKNIILKIKDFGIGNEHINFGFGLSNMKYRVEALKGRVSVFSQLNIGTTIEIEIPI